MTIGKKLSIAVGAMTAVVLALGIAAWTSIGKLNTELEIATQKTARRLQLAGTMDTAGSDMLAAMRGIVMFSFDKDASGVQMCKTQFDGAAATWQKAIDEVRPLIIREDGRRIVNQLQEQLTAWQAVIIEVEQAATRDPFAAVIVAKTKGLPIYQANSRDSERFRAIQNEILATQKATGQSMYRTSLWLTLGFLCLSMAAGALALRVVRGASRDLRRTAATLNSASDQLTSAARQISSASESLAQGATEQATSLEETSASSEQLSASTRENAKNSQTAADLMNETAKVAGDANRTLDEMEGSMAGINASSQKISKIMRVIDEIAFQTNILALNAAVEAARAGEAGLGFAVVADEVRNLAQRCAQAAKDTAGMIEESIAKSSEGSQRLELVSGSIRTLTEKSTEVKALIEALKVSSGEQACGVQQIAQAILQVDQVTRNAAASAEEAAAAGQELSSHAAGLQEMVRALQGLVGVD